MIVLSDSTIKILGYRQGWKKFKLSKILTFLAKDCLNPPLDGCANNCNPYWAANYIFCLVSKVLPNQFVLQSFMKWFDAFYLFQPSPIMLSLFYAKYQFCRRNMNIQTIPFIFYYIKLTVLCTRQLFQKPQLFVL